MNIHRHAQAEASGGFMRTLFVSMIGLGISFHVGLAEDSHNDPLINLYCGTAPGLPVVGTLRYNPNSKTLILALSEFRPATKTYSVRPPSQFVTDSLNIGEKEITFSGHVDYGPNAKSSETLSARIQRGPAGHPISASGTYQSVGGTSPSADYSLEFKCQARSFYK
jgi:hypothetical protein